MAKIKVVKPNANSRNKPVKPNANSRNKPVKGKSGKPVKVRRKR